MDIISCDKCGVLYDMQSKTLPVQHLCDTLLKNFWKAYRLL